MEPTPEIQPGTPVQFIHKGMFKTAMVVERNDNQSVIVEYGLGKRIKVEFRNIKAYWPKGSKAKPESKITEAKYGSGD